LEVSNYFRIANEIYQRINILYKIELEHELGLRVALFKTSSCSLVTIAVQCSIVQTMHVTWGNLGFFFPAHKIWALREFLRNVLQDV
jgi:hypothetical protein